MGAIAVGKESYANNVASRAALGGGIVLYVGGKVLDAAEEFGGTFGISERSAKPPEEQLKENRRDFGMRLLQYFGFTTIAAVGGAALGHHSHNRKEENRETFEKHGATWSVRGVNNHPMQGVEVHIVSQKTGIMMSVHVEEYDLAKIEERHNGRTLEKGDVWKMSHREDLTRFVLVFEELLSEEGAEKKELREE